VDLRQEKFNLIKKFTSRWSYEFEEDEMFINMFIMDNLIFISKYPELYTQQPVRLSILAEYYYRLLKLPLELSEETFINIDVVKDLNFFLKLSTKYFKTKYTITNFDFVTLVTASVGMILKYYGNFRKSFKRSHRANVLLIKFVISTVMKLIRKQKYIFIIEGFNSKIFKLINLFNFLKKDTNLTYYLIQPKLIFGKRVFKKIKSIKRKIQKKNASSVKFHKSYLKKFNISSYTI